jgi:hypothetical protein
MVKGNNEIFGMSCEKAVCLYFKDKNINKIDKNRCNMSIVKKLLNIFPTFFIINNIKKLVYSGYNNNIVDFIDDKHNTYSMKSNTKNNNKVCPQVIGQPYKNKFITNVYNKVNKVKTTKLLCDSIIKKNIIRKIDKYLNLYFKYLFCCDYIIHIQGNTMEPRLINRRKFKFIKSNITFTRYEKEWKESTTVKYNDISIGEFQFHQHGIKKGIIKFRFHLNRLLSIL